MRTCRYCGRDETQVRFYDRESSSGVAAGKCCQPCWVNKSVEWRRNNREKWRTASHRRATIKRLGITGEEYDAFYPEGAKCAACGATEGQQRMGKPCRLVVDHDHQTGRVRGILCHPCNMAAGHADDNPAVLRALADYLDWQ